MIDVFHGNQIQSLGTLREPPNTASIYSLANLSQARKNDVSEFGRSVLTPLAFEIAAFVVHDAARVKVTHHFHNESAEPIGKASYAFPVPPSYTVTDFSCRVGGRKVVAVVQPAAQARDRFLEAVREKKTAALLEQHKDTSKGIITVQLGNILGEALIKTEIELVMLLKRRILVSDGAEASVTTLTIPLSMASRYGGSVAEEAHGAPLRKVPAGIREGASINVEVVQSPELHDLTLWCPSHGDIVNIQSESRNKMVQSILDLPSSGSATNNNSTAHSVLKATLEDKKRLLDRSFVLEIKSRPEAGGPKAQAWLETHPDPDLADQQALMMRIPPSAVLSASRSRASNAVREVIFLLDQSNSMDDKIGSLVALTKIFLHNIPSGWKFNILRFGSTYTSLLPASQEKQEGNLKEALQWVQEKCQGNMGGTELASVLKGVLKSARPAYPTEVLLITDGQVWRLEETLELIETTRRESRGPVRFFCLGIGDMTSRALIEGLAESGGGYCDIINSQDDSGEKLVAMLAFVLTPGLHINPVRVLLNGKLLMPDPALRSPGLFSRLNQNVLRGQSILVLLDSSPGQEIKSVVVVFSNDDGEEMEIDIPVHVLEQKDDHSQTRRPGPFGRSRPRIQQCAHGAKRTRMDTAHQRPGRTHCLQMDVALQMDKLRLVGSKR